MRYGKISGMAAFAAGIIILIAYGLYEGFGEIDLQNLNVIVALGVSAIIIGFIILFISIFIEQQKRKKEMQTEIDKEDLEP